MKLQNFIIISVVLLTLSVSTLVVTGQSNITVIENFEDGDLSPSHPDWEGWNSTDGGTFESTENSLNGDFSGQLNQSSGDAGYEITTTNEDFTPDSIRFVMTYDNVGNDQAQVHIDDIEGNRVIDIEFHTDNYIYTRVSSGNGTILENTGWAWAPGFKYTVDLYNIDYETDTYNLSINGENLGQFDFTDGEFSQVSAIEPRLQDGGSMRIDSIAFNAGKSNPIFERGTMEDFEDGEITSNPEWLGVPSNFDAQSSTVIAGSESGEISGPSDPHFSVLSTTPETISMKIEVDTMDSNSYVLRLEYSKGGVIMWVRFDTDGTVTGRDGGNSVDTDFDWETDTEYNVSIANVDYENEEYDIYIDDTPIATDYGFQVSRDRINRIGFLSQGSNTQYYIDDINGPVCIENCDIFEFGGDDLESDDPQPTQCDYQIENIPDQESTCWIGSALGFDDDQSTSFGMGSEIQWVFLAIMVGSMASWKARNEYIGIGVIIALIILFWINDSVSLGITLVALFYGIFIGYLQKETPSRSDTNVGGFE